MSLLIIGRGECTLGRTERDAAGNIVQKSAAGISRGNDGGGRKGYGWKWRRKVKRLTFSGNFCDIAQCSEIRGGEHCPDGYCSQRRVWERLKEYEDKRLEPEEIRRLKQDWTAIDALRTQADVEQNELLTPCDLCIYNPPSSFDGKPCCLCPATAEHEPKEDDNMLCAGLEEVIDNA